MADSHTRISTNSHELFIVSGGLFVVDGDFYYAVFLVFEDVVGFLNAAEGEAVGDEWGGVDFALLDEAKHFLAVATVNAARLEGEVLAIHVGQGEHLWLVVEGHDGDDGVGACALPCQLESGGSASHFKHTVGTAMVAVALHEVHTFIGRGEQHIGVVIFHKSAALFRLLAHDDALGLLQHGAQQRADAGGACTDDEHGVVGGNFADSSRPESRGEHVAHEKRLLVGHSVGNTVQALRSQWHTHIFGLSAVDAATQCPTAVGRGAVVHKAMLAEETFTAEGLHVHRHTVAHLHALHVGADFLHHAHHFVAHGDAWHGSWHASVLDVEVA